MKYPCFLLMLCIGFFSASATVTQITLTKALSKKFITMEATGKGGYQGKCISLRMHNNTTVPLDVTIDHAMIFKPADSSFQDLFVVGDEMIALKPNADISISLETFCAKSYARCPKAGLNYKFWKQGDSTMVKVARFIKAKGLFDFTGQQGIWSLTNNHSLSGIYNPSNTDASNDLAKYISFLTGKKLPQYHTTNKVSISHGDYVFNPVIERYIVEMDWVSPNPRNMHVTVYKENWEVYWEEKKETITANNHKIIVELDPAKVPPGKYYVQLRNDDNVIYKKVEVVVEEPPTP